MVQPFTTPDYFGAEKFIHDYLEVNLSPTLYYHNLQHTLYVLSAAMNIASFYPISKEEKSLLRIAALFHDSGLVFTYDGHEERGCELAKELLPQFKFSPVQINSVCTLIMATKLPQQPHTLLEEIICDADLDYLGNPGVELIANKLFEELKLRAILSTKEDWINRQIRFLSNHTYFTDYSLQHREENKKAYYDQLKALI